MSMFHKMRQQKLLSATLLLATLTVGILIGTLVTAQLGPAQAQNGAADATPLAVPPLDEIGNEFTELAKQLDPSVVNITVESKADPNEAAGLFPGGDEDLPDIYRRFFGEEDGQPAPEPRTRVASGTGFIVDPNGYIITNNHVVENADKITVKLHSDSTQLRARVIGTDWESDLAVIKIDAGRPLKPVKIGNSDAVQTGDWAVAIGSPFRLEATVTAGIVSAIGRSPDEVGAEGAFQSFIQTDAAINPGNSGGPLVNIRGEVIGVNTMIATTRGGSEGVGFALPMNMAVRVYNDIIRDGRVTRGSVGVLLSRSNRPETMLQAFGLDHGAVIEEVGADGPAATAGVLDGDIILAINGEPVQDNGDLVTRVADLPVGKPATFSIDRDGHPVELQVTIADRLELYKDDARVVGPGSRPRPAATEEPEHTNEVQFGIAIRSLNGQEQEIAPSRRGVAVREVVAGSFAEEIGIQANDIIDSINRRPVASIDDIREIQQNLEPGDAVAFHVIRSYGGGRGPAETASVYLAGDLPSN